MKLATEQDRTRYIAFLQAQALPLDVQCEPWRQPRTLPQNAYLWAAVYAPLVERCGFSPEEWHEFFCGEFFGWLHNVKPSGESVSVPKRTTTKNEHGKRDVLKGKAFADFVTFVESECAKRGVFVVEQWKEAA
jgi:hypothetical protein